jgi:ATP-binding cassette subfamily F protein 3
MLVLSRKLGEKIFIGENICITVVDIDRGKIRLGIEAPPEEREMDLLIPPPPEIGNVAMNLVNAGAKVGEGETERWLFRQLTLSLKPGQCTGIVGRNGAGKTTLLRVLGGQLEPRTGQREVFPLTRSAYFAQHAAETLDPGLTVLGALEEIATPEWRPRLRGLLGSFLFGGDDVFKLCRVLSGGERQRVALARILLAPANLLLLDEPTHHLDLAGKEVLEDALDQYPGAVVVVTHDRSLMARLATRVLEVNDGRVVLYPGGYDDYEAARLSRVAGTASPARVGAEPPPRKAPSAPTPAVRASESSRVEARRERAERQRRDREQARLEKDIEAREARRVALEQQLADPDVYHDGARAKELVGEYERLRAELESLWQRIGEL